VCLAEDLDPKEVEQVLRGMESKKSRLSSPRPSSAGECGKWVVEMWVGGG